MQQIEISDEMLPSEQAAARAMQGASEGLDGGQGGQVQHDR
jgi:hypothetical protein